MSLSLGQGVLISAILVGSSITLPFLQPEAVVAQVSESEESPILQQLIGTWRGEDPTTQAPIILVLNPLGQVYLLAKDETGNPTAIKMWYEINTLTEPFQFDLQLNAEQTAPTVFEITPQGQMRLTLEGISPETPRPATLANATVFEKVSEDTAVADNYQVVELPPPATTPSIPVQYITALAQSQLSYFEETGEFTDDLDNLGIVGLMETQEYNYAFQTFDENQDQVAIIAEPKEEELSSYIGAIFVQAEGDEQKIIAGICKTDKPTTLPPAMPKVTEGMLQCPAGATLVE